MKGSYLLIVRLDQGKRIRVGGRELYFERGYYCYTGSALNGLEPRLRRHLQKNKNRHWHIDHLTEEARPLKAFLFPSSQRLECDLNSRVKKVADSEVKGFGSSDCRCSSHLNYFPEDPEGDLLHSLRRFSRESNLTLRLERWEE